jgi:hypothetical protein
VLQGVETAADARVGPAGELGEAGVGGAVSAVLLRGQKKLTPTPARAATEKALT